MYAVIVSKLFRIFINDNKIYSNYKYMYITIPTVLIILSIRVAVS